MPDLLLHLENVGVGTGIGDAFYQFGAEAEPGTHLLYGGKVFVGDVLGGIEVEIKAAVLHKPGGGHGGNTAQGQAGQFLGEIQGFGVGAAHIVGAQRVVGGGSGKGFAVIHQLAHRVAAAQLHHRLAGDLLVGKIHPHTRQALGPGHGDVLGGLAGDDRGLGEGQALAVFVQQQKAAGMGGRLGSVVGIKIVSLQKDIPAVGVGVAALHVVADGAQGLAFPLDDHFAGGGAMAGAIEVKTFLIQGHNGQRPGGVGLAFLVPVGHLPGNDAQNVGVCAVLHRKGALFQFLLGGGGPAVHQGHHHIVFHQGAHPLGPAVAVCVGVDVAGIYSQGVLGRLVYLDLHPGKVHAGNLDLDGIGLLPEIGAGEVVFHQQGAVVGLQGSLDARGQVGVDDGVSQRKAGAVVGAAGAIDLQLEAALVPGTEGAVTVRHPAAGAFVPFIPGPLQVGAVPVVGRTGVGLAVQFAGPGDLAGDHLAILQLAQVGGIQHHLAAVYPAHRKILGQVAGKADVLGNPVQGGGIAGEILTCHPQGAQVGAVVAHAQAGHHHIAGVHGDLHILVENMDGDAFAAAGKDQIKGKIGTHRTEIAAGGLGRGGEQVVEGIIPLPELGHQYPAGQSLSGGVGDDLQRGFLLQDGAFRVTPAEQEKGIVVIGPAGDAVTVLQRLALRLVDGAVQLHRQRGGVGGFFPGPDRGGGHKGAPEHGGAEGCRRAPAQLLQKG